MEAFFEKYKCPIGRMINIWGERMGLEEWAIREAVEEYYKKNKDKPINNPIDISWDVLSLTEAKRPVILKQNNKTSDPELWNEINRLRGVIANKEDLYGKLEAVQGKLSSIKEQISDLAQDNVAFFNNISELDEAYSEKFDTVEKQIEDLRLATELNKLEIESKDLKAEVKGKRRFWQRKKDV